MAAVDAQVLEDADVTMHEWAPRGAARERAVRHAQRLGGGGERRRGERAAGEPVLVARGAVVHDE